MIFWDALKTANDALNAFTDFDRSANGGEGALSGVSVGVKANIAVRDMPWTAGCDAYRSRVAERDADVVTALRSAGAAIVGMLNMEEAALGAKTDNPWFGATQNPHRVGYSPGGSSGGSGAAVAAGLCDVALGTDTMGSVRIPAAYCGVYGFKPANAAVSQSGLELAEASLDVIGPLARSLDMLERVAMVMSKFAKVRAKDCAGATLVGHEVACVDDIISNFAYVRGVTGSLTEVRLSHPLSRIRYAGFIKTSKAMATHFVSVDSEKLSPNLRNLLSYGPRRSDVDWAEDLIVLTQTALEMHDIISKHGVLLLPTAPQTAFAHSEDAPANQADFTCIANIAGLPAISIPSGWSANGLPCGVQLIGAAGAESLLFDFARKLDTKLAAYRPPATFIHEGETVPRQRSIDRLAA